MLGLAVQHDLAFVLDALGLSSMVPANFQAPEGESGLTEPERVKRLFEALGPTFVKMGQILSTRPDLIPPAYIAEFKKLQDSVGPIPFEEIRAVAEEDLGKTLEEAFAEVDPEPLASASIGQVHVVVLTDGKKAAMKVQRPGIERVIRQDLAILRGIATLAKGSGLAEPLDPVAIVREFERSILRELDYIVEGRATDMFREQHAGDDQIVVPEVYWDQCAKRVLTMEFVDAVKVSDIARLREAGHDTARIAAKLVDVILEQIFIFGRFHADPHPGNLMVLADGRLALIDFGMSGHFDRSTRHALIEIIADVASGDHHQLADHLLAHDILGYDADLRAVRKELRELFRSVDGGAGMHELMELFIGFIVQHKLDFPPDLFFLDKVFGTLDGAVKTLDPKLRVRDLARSFVPRMVAGSTDDWQTMLTDLVRRVVETDQQLIQLPGKAGRLLDRADAGHFRVVSVSSDEQIRAHSRLVLKAGLLALGLLWMAGSIVLANPMYAGAALGIGASSFLVSAVWILRS